ncbi:MAG: hypothetical protein VKL59_07545 [Nostocaceae cyanobacterium]|nr:hypothetical protein [Nostocaceae cyanobacterium]
MEQDNLFVEITKEESAVVSGGFRGRRFRAANNNSDGSGNSGVFQVNLAQIIFALGAAQFTFLLTGNSELANSVLTTQWNRAFRSFF